MLEGGVESNIERVPVLVPGLFGSTLRYGEHYIWDRCLRQNFQNLLRDPQILTWSGSAAEANFVSSYTVHGVVHLDIWSRSIAFLRRVPGLAPENYWLLFGYDWRQSVEASAKHLCTRLSDCADASVAGPPTAEQGRRFVILSHSMGGLVVRAALGAGYLHPAWCDRLIHIGTPTRGAPAAMQAAFDPNEWPFLARLFSAAWLVTMGRRSKLIRAMQEAARSFDSAYQLLPPKTIMYAYDKPDEPYFNPLDAPASRFSPAQIQLADTMSSLLAAADNIVRTFNVRTYVVHSKGCSTPMFLNLSSANGSYLA